MIDMLRRKIEAVFQGSPETAVDWLWYPFIPYGKLTLQGDPGCGKSTLMMRPYSSGIQRELLHQTGRNSKSRFMSSISVQRTVSATQSSPDC